MPDNIPVPSGSEVSGLMDYFSMDTGCQDQCIQSRSDTEHRNWSFIMALPYFFVNRGFRVLRSGFLQIAEEFFMSLGLI